MQRVLSLDQSPALGAVMRYFLGTPLFLLLAGLLLGWHGEAAFQSRWSPVTLALTHLLTLGVLGMSIIGALIQILPVVAGSVIPRLHAMATTVHALLGTGTLCLAAAFLSSAPWLFRVALATLIPALIWATASFAIGLWQRPPDGALPMASTMRLALASLVITVTLGALLGAAFAWPASPSSLPLTLTTDLHALWGIFGWAGMLLAGVALQVVPMFQVTPLYGRRLGSWFGASGFLSLFLYSVNVTLGRSGEAPLGSLPAALLLLPFAAFAVATIRLLARRTRPPDVMTLFWRLAMGCMLAAALLWAAPPELAGPGQALAPGMLVIVGFLFSAVNGMLYKIVPFLVWHQLQANAHPGQHATPVRQIIPEHRARRQFWLHCLALALLVAACWFPGLLARPAGLAMAAAALSLGSNLVGAARLSWQQLARAPESSR